MKLYLLKRKDVVGHDELDAVLVRAEDSRRARELAATSAGDETPRVWLLPLYTSCRQVKAEGPEATIIVDFHAG